MCWLLPYLKIPSIVLVFVTFCTILHGNKGEPSEVGGAGCSHSHYMETKQY